MPSGTAVDEVEAACSSSSGRAGACLRLGEQETDAAADRPDGVRRDRAAAAEDQALGLQQLPHTPEELLERYIALLEAVRSLPSLAGFCYTQLTDTYQEANGLLYADRTPKIPLDQARWPPAARRRTTKIRRCSLWRNRLMELQK